MLGTGLDLSVKESLMPICEVIVKFLYRELKLSWQPGADIADAKLYTFSMH